MLVPILILALFTLFSGVIGIPFNQGGEGLDILSKLLTPSINLLDPNLKESKGWYQFFTNATFSVSIAFGGIFLASFLYKPVYSSLQNLNFINLVVKKGSQKTLREKLIYLIYRWSYNRGYIDVFYAKFIIRGLRGLAELIHFFDRQIIDRITNVMGLTSFFLGEGIKYVGGGRISSYLLLYLFAVFIFLVIKLNFIF